MRYLEVLDKVQDSVVESLRGHRLARDPAIDVRVGGLEQGLVLAELRLAQLVETALGEAPQQQVHFARPPVPAAKIKALQARGAGIRHSLIRGWPRVGYKASSASCQQPREHSAHTRCARKSSIPCSRR